jgi:hypothetical protein
MESVGIYCYKLAVPTDNQEIQMWDDPLYLSKRDQKEVYLLDMETRGVEASFSRQQGTKYWSSAESHSPMT